MNEFSVYQDTSARLELLKEAILMKWESQVRETMGESGRENSTILRNHIPEILDHLQDILKTSTVSPVELGKAHGFQRVFLTDYSLEDLLREYGLLRETLIDYLYPVGDISCTKLIHSYLDVLSRNSVLEFVKHLMLSRRLNDISDVKEFDQILSEDQSDNLTLATDQGREVRP